MKALIRHQYQATKKPEGPKHRVIRKSKESITKKVVKELKEKFPGKRVDIDTTRL